MPHKYIWKSKLEQVSHTVLCEFLSVFTVTAYTSNTPEISQEKPEYQR
jgi:hypothetical protein